MVNWEPLTSAPWIVQLHAFSAIAAFALGLVQFAGPKGTLAHKTLGAIWIVLMTTISITGIFINPALHGFDLPLAQWFSWIHVFVPITLYGVIQGAYFLIRGGPGLRRHAGPFVGIFIGGLIVAGGFAFLPGRIMHQVVFAQNADAAAAPDAKTLRAANAISP